MAHDYEFYETPRPLVRYLFRELVIQGRCFEPCVGSGAIIDASRISPGERSWVTNDIDPRWDADYHLDAASDVCWESAGQVDWTVTNTPFSLAIPILERAIQRSSVGVAAYLRLSIHEVLKTGARRTWFGAHPPTDLFILPRFAHQRSQKTGEWATDNVTCCWTVWRRGVTTQRIAYAPELVVDELRAFEPKHRLRMDALMAMRRAA